MATKRETLKSSQADVMLPCSGGLAVVAAAPDGKPGALPESFAMELYTGAVFAGHWYWGDVILDVAGFAPDRQDVPAMRNHWRDETAGWTKSLQADAARGRISAQGVFLSGTAEQEPAADLVKRRMAQGYPWQASGRWTPKQVEQVQAGATATVNGRAVQGPVAIFRRFGLVEASFVEIGWDGMTGAVAAEKDNDTPVNVEILTMKPDPVPAAAPAAPAPAAPPPAPAASPAAPVPILTALKDAFGADRAIELVAAKPDGKTMADFSDELVGALKAARTDGEAKAAKVRELEAALAAAKKAPPVISAAGDAAQPKPPAEAGGDEALKAKWAGSKDLQAEFPKVEWYLTAVSKNLAKA